MSLPVIPSADDALEEGTPPANQTNGTAEPTKDEPKAKAPKAKPAKKKAETKAKATKAKATVKPKDKEPKKAAKPNMKELEATYAKRYPKQKIVEGSLKDVGEHEGFPHKRTIAIHCQACDKKRRIATSDLHQTNHCIGCMKQARLDKRKKTKPAKAKASKKKATKREAAAATA